MKIEKVRDVKTPERGTQWSAGIDFFVPNDIEEIILKPNEDINIPSGIKCKIPHGYSLLGVNKSGISLNKKLQVGACLIDEDYTGEIHLHVFNSGRKDISIKSGDKLVQFILTPVFYDEIELVSTIQRDTLSTPIVRGDGMFGSTNNKQPEAKEIKEVKLPKFERVSAYLYKIDQTKTSKWGGTYKRHYFKDCNDEKIIYILDVCWKSKNIFKFLDINDVVTNLIVFTQGPKNFINGKSIAIKVGKWENLKKHFKKQLTGIKL